MQVKLLRVLQERRFERLGGTRTLTADVRIIAATNRDLETLVRTGDFREDLFYRLNVVSILVPPLRERREDIPALVDRFLAAFAQAGAERPRISREAMDALVKYDYPGNVRELENIVQRASALARTSLIGTADLPGYVTGLHPERASAEPTSLPARVAQLERRMIIDALERAGGVQTRAAALLGISERHLRYKLRKHRLESALPASI
jgi:two-component system NtrC family response regulator